MRDRSFVQAHGSSTPQNRTTETRILDFVAAAFEIKEWPVTAVKAFVGHPLAPASGDQLVNALGVLRHGILPGIKTLERLADDLYNERLNIPLSDVDLGERAQIAFLNSKGFGGNNATGTVVSPATTEAMLTKRHGTKAMAAYRAKREAVEAEALAYDSECQAGPMRPIYRFGEALIDEDAIAFEGGELSIPGYKLGVELSGKNLYPDMV